MHPSALSSFWRQSLLNVSWKEVSLLWRENDIFIWIILRRMLSHVQTWFFSITGWTCSRDEIKITRLTPYIRWAHVWVMRNILNWNGFPSLSVLSSKKRNSMRKRKLLENKFALLSCREKVLKFPYLQCCKDQHFFFRAVNFFQEDGPPGLFIELVDSDSVVLREETDRCICVGEGTYLYSSVRKHWKHGGHSLLTQKTCAQVSERNTSLSTAPAPLTSELRNCFVKIFSRASSRGQIDPSLIELFLPLFYHTSTDGKNHCHHLLTGLSSTNKTATLYPLNHNSYSALTPRHGIQFTVSLKKKGEENMEEE